VVGLNKTASASIFFIAISLVVCVPQQVLADSSINRISDKAVSFVSDRFNASMGLCSEVVEETPNSIGFSGSVYWIYSDNVLAYALLRKYNLTTANVLRQSLLNYASAYHLDNDSNGFPIDFKHEPILSAFVTEDFNGSVGDSFPSNFVPRNAVLRDLNVSSSFKVCTEIDNGSDVAAYSNFVDWLAWIGLSCLNSGNRSLATQYYDDIMKFWQGNGFHDRRYDELGYYETFKLGLVIYFRKALQLSKPDAEKTMERIIEICQLDNGGVCVNYNDALEVWGNPNVETSALVGLAGIVKIPESCSALVMPLVIGTVAIVTVTLVACIFYSKRKRVPSAKQTKETV